MSTALRRVFIIVIDAFGIGAMPDAEAFNDSLEFNTLASIDREAPHLNVPTLARLGLGNIIPLIQVARDPNALGSYGKMAERSIGKDTTTGHWEMAGVYLDTPFPTYPDGFPAELVSLFCEKIGVQGVLANKPASGTAIIDECGEEHLKTAKPIVYTSADSVWQIAAHTDKVPLETLYEWCEVARELLVGEHEVSRVIARPFIGEVGSFTRLGAKRKDYAVPPKGTTTLDMIKEQGALSVAVGKIEDIFCSEGITHSVPAKGNPAGLKATRELIENTVALDEYDLAGKKLSDYEHSDKRLMFINLVDTDMNFGHRRDVPGYAGALEAIDVALAPMLDALTDDDLLMITADHGCDPTAPGSDHTREYVPILMYNKKTPARNLGIRTSFADIGKTTLAWLGLSHDAHSGHVM